jgi:hypothetical protein
MKHADGQPKFHSTFVFIFLLGVKTYKYIMAQNRAP